MTKPTKIPSIYCIGNRNISVLHARLRNNCSNLNEDLYKNHLRLDRMCECGNEIETQNIISVFPLYRATRAFHPFSVHKLLCGIANSSTTKTVCFLRQFTYYIKDSKRFVWKALTVLYVLNSCCPVNTAIYYVKFSVYSAVVSLYCVHL